MNKGKEVKSQIMAIGTPDNQISSNPYIDNMSNNFLRVEIKHVNPNLRKSVDASNHKLKPLQRPHHKSESLGSSNLL